MSFPHYCRVCKKNFNSEKQLLQHEQGKGHSEQLENASGVERNASPTTSSNCKTVLCDFFKRGCKFKEDCKFAHQPEDVTPARPMCRYVLGYCSRGNSCAFAHGLDALVCSKMEGMTLRTLPKVSQGTYTPPPTYSQGYTSPNTTASLPSTPQQLPSSPSSQSVVLQSEFSTTLVKSYDGTTMTSTTTDSSNRVVEIVVTRLEGSNVTVATTDVAAKTVTTVTTNTVTGNVMKDVSSLPHYTNKKKKQTFRINLYCGNCGCQQEWDDGRILV